MSKHFINHCISSIGSNVLCGFSANNARAENKPAIAGLNSIRKILLAWFCLILASCVGPNISNWPDTIPRQQFFVEAYLADADNQQLQSRTEYLEWAMSFYQGNLAYQSGWLDIESVVLNGAASGDASKLTAQLKQLGANIGVEWAKHNRLRLIDSRMLALWGSALQLAENPEQQKQSIELIVEDVSGLLNGNLNKNDIVESRYAELLQLDTFGGF